MPDLHQAGYSQLMLLFSLILLTTILSLNLFSTVCDVCHGRAAEAVIPTLHLY